MIDLHCHSTASDGTLSPAQLVKTAVDYNLKALALTDHDTVAGIEEFLNQQSQHPACRLIAGVEISSLLNNRELHLVGLFIDPDNAALRQLLTQIRHDREQRNLTIISRLNELGYEINYTEVKAAAGGAVIGRPHFAAVLMQKYHFPSRQAVFDACLKRGTGGYIPRRLPAPQTVIDIIHQADGCVIWAHPIYRDRGERSFMRRILKLLVPVGLDGVEAYYSGFSAAQQQTVLELAAEFNIMLSGGSDFHGENIPDIKLGRGYGDLQVPDELYPLIEQRATAYRTKIGGTDRQIPLRGGNNVML